MNLTQAKQSTVAKALHQNYRIQDEAYLIQRIDKALPSLIVDFPDEAELLLSLRDLIQEINHGC